MFFYIHVYVGALVLDGMQLKNVVIENSEVEYTGEDAIQLENVWFVNCTFILPPNNVTRAFGNAILAQAPVTFQRSSSG
jgi:hypothetical protein